MVKLLLVIGAVLAVTVNRTDGTVTLPTNTLKVQPGRNIQFSCQVTAGESFVTWITPAKAARPGKPGIPSVRITTSQTTGRRRIAESGDTYALLIDTLTVDDGGEYICQGSSNSEVFTLQVDFSTAQVDLEQEIHLGRKAVIKLDVSSYPLPTYEWTKDGKPLTFPAQGKSLDKYTGSITIDNVKLSDEGNYTCKVTFGTFATVKIEVVVIDPPSINKDASPTPLYSIVGNRKPVTVTCSFYGKPVPTVIMVVENGTEIARGNSLASYTLTTTTENDFGKFNCSAENPYGKAEYTVELRKADVPQIRKYQGDPVRRRLTQGSNVTFHCDVISGSPKPEVTWWFGWTDTTMKIDINYDSRYSRPTDETWTITGVWAKDQGRYRCRAKNIAGEAFLKFEITDVDIIAAPKINRVASPTPVYSFVGNRKPVTVTCSFYGYPVPRVIMADENGTEIATGNGSASQTFATTTESDFGMYNCSAHSPVGSAQYLLELRKAVPPGPPRNVAANKTCNQVTLHWQPPLVNGGMEIVSYIITVLSNGSQLFTENFDRHSVEGNIGFNFKPETTYEVRLKARSEAGFGKEESLFVTINKYMYCTARKPFITNTEVEVDTEFTVTWSAPQNDSDNNNNTEYRVEWRKKPITNQTKLDKQENINETRFRITGLEHNAEYEIRLYAVYRYGVSKPDVRSFKTKVGKPSEILNLQAVAACNSITLTWEPPKDDGGIPINKYVLNCTSDYEDTTRNISTDNTSYTIKDLKYNTKYNITLRATNKAEWGPTSSVEVKTTEYCAPGRPIIYSPSSTLLTTDSFTLKWRRPEETGGDDDITYTVRYSVVSDKNSSPWIMKTITTKELQLKITRLDNKVQYKFQVTAKNKGGESRPDERIIQTNFSGGSSQSRLVSSVFLTILIGGLSLLL